jgi:hypothetical protein
MMPPFGGPSRRPSDPGQTSLGVAIGFVASGGLLTAFYFIEPDPDTMANVAVAFAFAALVALTLMAVKGRVAMAGGMLAGIVLAPAVGCFLIFWQCASAK